ncbi:MAG: protein-disulfide reductase DsbD domain-containing protein [Myxococcota bacterium]
MLRLLCPLVLVLGLVSACQESHGGFGDADIKDPGIHVKPTDDKAAAPPDFAGALRLTSSLQGDALRVDVNLRPGFHAYAPGEEIGRPVSLVVKPDNGWQLEGTPAVPAGVTKDLGELGKSQVLEGDFSVTATVRGGSGALRGDLEIQVCTDNACDRPRKHSFEVPAS